MKYLLLIFVLGFSLNVFSQERYSPKFSCTEKESGEQYLVLVGNKFSQVEGMDYSSELKFVEARYYFDGTASFYDVFKLKYLGEKSFSTETLRTESEGIDLGSISLEMDESGELIQTFIMPDEHADFLGIEDTTMILKFDCKKF